MKTLTSAMKHITQRTARMQPDNLYFIGDLALLRHTHQQIQVKTARITTVSASVVLNIHKGKSKILKYNTERINQITLDGEAQE
ncbi:unnamed protein product [Schistosoma margrebowiei]|uniref:Uncharacterized protein n=1 Tax=Schistosoma margrebowiei TaxID=48269 RepID=A0A183LSS7_9TREM|nr:unnamed protein product [Schistosoma margrebowiei]